MWSAAFSRDIEITQPAGLQPLKYGSLLCGRATALEMASTRYFRALHRFAVATASFTALLLVAGALVTSHDAADSVPDWPLAYGRIIPPLIGGIRFEFAHRVIAGIVAVLSAVLAVWLARADPRPYVRRLGWTALALVIAQALLGATRVLFGHPPIVATAHATLAQIFFMITIALALFTSDWGRRELPQWDDSGNPSLRALSMGTTAAILVQLVLGAGFRHGAFGIWPHVAGAAVVTVLVVLTGRAVRKRFGKVWDLRRWGLWLQSLIGIQLLLGGAAYWTILAARNEPQPSALYVYVTVAHVLFGALTLAASVLLTLSCRRLIRAGGSVVVDSPAARARVSQ